MRDGDEVYLSSPRLKRNCDEYTQRLLKKISTQYPDKVRTNTGQTPTHRYRLRLRHSMKEANASPEKEKNPKKEPKNGGAKPGEEKVDYYNQEIEYLVDKLYLSYWKEVSGDRSNNVHAWVGSQRKKKIQPGAIWAYLKHIYDMRAPDRPANPWSYSEGFMKSYTMHDVIKRDDIFGSTVEKMKKL